MSDCEKQLWLVFSHLCFLNVRSMKSCMYIGHQSRREARVMDENNREEGERRNGYDKVHNAVVGKMQL